jgi:hypothetical protein
MTSAFGTRKIAQVPSLGFFVALFAPRQMDLSGARANFALYSAHTYYVESN